MTLNLKKNVQIKHLTKNDFAHDFKLKIKIAHKISKK